MKSYKVKCACKHEFQDKEHGSHVRVANPTSRLHPDGQIEVRCTVCNTTYKVKKG